MTPEAGGFAEGGGARAVVKRYDPSYPLFGILNPYGQFWTHETFTSEALAKEHVRNYWRNPIEEQGFKVVPVRLVIELAEQTPMTNPTDQDVAALVASHALELEQCAARIDSKVIENSLRAAADFLRGPVATALSTLAAERDEALRLSRLNYDDATQLSGRLEASEARATSLEAERNEMREFAREKLEGKVRAEAQLARAREALQEARKVMRNAWGAVTSDQVVDKQVDKMLKRGFEAVDEALRSPAPADGRGDNQMLASASFPQELPDVALDEDRVPTWPPLKLALWHVVTGEKLNDGHYVNAYELTDKLHAAALLSSGRNLADATPKPDLPSEAREDGVKVKALEWSEPGNRHLYKSCFFTTWRAESILGTRVIQYVEHSTEPSPGRDVLKPFAPYFDVGGDTIEEAKAIVQADYEARIRNALVGSLPNLADATPKPDLPSEARADVEREAFEAWVKATPYPRCDLTRGSDRIFGTGYLNPKTALAWDAWKARSALTAPDHGDVASQGGELPDDTVRLIIAARIVAYGDEADAKTELDKAVEAFAERVPWDDEPDDVASQGGEK